MAKRRRWAADGGMFNITPSVPKIRGTKTVLVLLVVMSFFCYYYFVYASNDYLTSLKKPTATLKNDRSSPAALFSQALHSDNDNTKRLQRPQTTTKIEQSTHQKVELLKSHKEKTIYYHYDKGKVPWWRTVVCKRGGHKAYPEDHLRLLFRNVTPEKDNNVFLMDTGCDSNPKYRVWCSVESWAKQNPDRQVWFLLTSGRLEGGEELPLKLQEKYSNLQVVTADLYDLFRNTSLLPLFESRKWTQKSTFPVELLSDMLRVLVLWWWGGVYSDTDVISLRKLTLSANSLGLEHSDQIGSAFYSFTAWHPTLLKLMDDMQHNFKPNIWGCIGPRAISRVMEKECEKKLPQILKEAPVDCPGNIKIHSTASFFPVRYNNFEKYFKPGGGKDFDKTFGNASALHFWNKMSKNSKVTVNSESVYEVVARRYCPVTYQTAIANSTYF